MRRPRAVALTGGIAAGKSEALKAFARHGAATASADAIVHELLAHDHDVREAIRARWGDEAVGDRARIGEIVFEDRGELEWLEQLLHPRVAAGAAGLARRASTRRSPSSRSRSSTRPAGRAASTRSSWSPRRLTCARRGAAPSPSRESRLLPDEEKLQRADFAYVNDGTLADLDAFVAGVVDSAEGVVRRLTVARSRSSSPSPGAFIYLQRAEPAWYARLWYPAALRDASCACTRRTTISTRRSSPP